MSLDEDKGHDHCGVVVMVDISGKTNVVPAGARTAGQLPHRGQLGWGAAWLDSSDPQHPIRHFTESGRISPELAERRLAEIGARSHAVILHTRYATNALLDPCMFQPYVYSHGESPLAFAMAFNGNLTNVDKRRRQLSEDGHELRREGDTEVLGHTLISGLRGNTHARMADAFRSLDAVSGAFSLVALTETGEVFGVRDRHGFHPLVRANLGSIHVIASEDEAVRLGLPGANSFSDIEPGHMLRIPSDFSPQEYTQLWAPKPSVCFFEYIYFSDCGSTIDGIPVANVRRRCGKILAEMDRDMPAEGLVVPVPDSAKIAARAYADARDLQNVDAIKRNRKVGRTFIGASQEQRERDARDKYVIDAPLIRGRELYLLEDSMVRGTTMKVLVADLYAAGATGIHLRLASPPILSPCFYGIDFPTVRELIVRRFFAGTLKEGDVLPEDVLAALAQEVGVDSIRYLPVSAIPRALGLPADHACMACVTGKYPTRKGAKLAQLQEDLQMLQR